MGGLAQKLELEGAEPLAHHLGLEGAEAPAAAAPPGPSAGEAFARGAGQGASLMMGDEAGGFGAFLASHLPGGGGDIERRAGRAFDAPLSTTTDYEVARNAERQANEAARAAHPIAYGGGELVGGTAPAIATGAALAPVTAGMTAAGGAALEGGVLGGFAGGGASTAETPGGVAKDVAIGAVTGAVTGGAITKAAPYVAKGVQKAAGYVGGKLKGGAETLGEVATEQRLAGAGVERAGMKKLRAKPGGLERYAEGADRLNIGGPLSSVRGHAEDAQAAADAAGAAKDAIVEQLDAAGATVHGADVGAAIRKLKSEHGAGVGKHLEEMAQEFDQMGEVPWSQMNLERKDIGSGTRWDSTSVQSKLSKKVYGKINEAMADAAEKIEPGLGKAWRSANEDEHIALKLAEMGENKLNTAGNRAMSPTDYAAGAAGTVVGGPTGTVLGVVANKALRSREHAMAAPVARAGASALESMGNAAESVGNALGRAATSPAGHVATESAAVSAAERATSDAVYGHMLSAHPAGHQRDVVYSTLLMNDPAFRERERMRAEQKTEEGSD